MKKFKWFGLYIVLMMLIMSVFPLVGSQAAAVADNIIYVPGNNNKDLQTAINEVSDDGIIEIAAGTYPTPNGGFSITTLNKSFTIRAAPGATVTMDGGGARRIFVIRDSPTSMAGGIRFERIIFSGGFSNPGLVNAILINHSIVTFDSCIFQNNVNGAVLVRNGASVFFENSIWRNNLTWNDDGAGFEIWDSTAYIHGSQFINNQNNATSTNSIPRGGAIYAVDATVRITNTRFDGNKNAGHGAGIYVIGQWTASGSNVIITDSTFINNRIVRSVGSNVAIEGGAINVEDKTVLRIDHSRFITNSAELGGGVNIFRSKVEINNSVFLGNQSPYNRSARRGGGGGAINFNFADRPDYASLTVQDSYIQGRYDTTTVVGHFGGGIHVVSSGYNSSIHPPVTVRRVVFKDLELEAAPESGSQSFGAGIAVQGASLLIEDSMIINCYARGGTSGSSGGGIIIFDNSPSTIRRTTFAKNAADNEGGALFVIGTSIDVVDSIFIGNEVSPGVSENELNSAGAAIVTHAPVSGSVVNSTFVSNIGMAIFDWDNTSRPINEMQYNNNRFYETTYGGRVYHDSLTATQTPSGLNSLVVNRSGGTPSTDKSVVANQALSSAPSISRLLGVPNAILPSSAAGDPQSNTTAYLAYVWSGGTARLNNSSLSSNASVQPTTNSGTHTLTVDGTSATVQLAAGPVPAVQTSLSSAGGTTSLIWDVSAGAFLSIAADQGLTVSTKNGTVTLPSTQRIYRLFAVTQQGGVVKIVDPRMPELSAPGHLSVLVGLNQPVKSGRIPFYNLGGASLDWSAQTTTPGLIQLQQTSGTITTSGMIPFLVNVSQPGTFQAIVNIDAGAAGSQRVIIDLLVVNVVRETFLPLTLR
ncbi:MAG: hypothetical protein A2W35_07615 [Chloroflexi bacterium RBG_16_57_11]|nr:MAG: hypothetical protein A2W35_07615 [Chloroflexi bacterium RBG_16_57_11]